ncbi:MAG: hypothetical protein WC323_01525, partial [Patescibacteria group bacterium]
MLRQFTKEKIKKAAASYIMLLLLVAFFVVPADVSAQGAVTPPPAGFEDNLGLDNIENEVMLDSGTDIRLFIARIINVFLGLLGIILLGLIIYGGWMYMTSEGDADKVNKAKAILKNAAIGLLIILSAFAIVTFILRIFFGGGGGPGGVGEPGEDWRGVSALGDGILESHYPTRDQRDVPINTSIFVTFKEEIDAGTICNITSNTSGNNEKCDGDTLISDNIRIYLSDKNGNDDNEDSNRRSNESILVTSTDNKTFIFRPLDFLGSQGSPAWFAVKLMGGGKIMKADGEDVQFDIGADDWYKWKFETNGKIDLTPPQVASIFPWPDNERDSRGVSVAAQIAKGSIEVNNKPKVYQVATVSSPFTGGGNTPEAVVNGNYTCDWAGEIQVAIDGTAADINGGGDGLIERDEDLTDGINLGCGLILQSGNRSYGTGNSWTIDVTPEIQADISTVGNQKIIFNAESASRLVFDLVSDSLCTFNFDNNAGCDVDDTTYIFDNFNSISNGGIAYLIKEFINKENNQVIAEIDSSNNTKINLIAEVAGASGNDIKLSTSNSNALGITPMSGGTDMTEDIRIQGLEDQPRNAVVQINFNEAVNPIYVSGDAGDINRFVRVQNAGGITAGNSCSSNKDCLSYNCNIQGGATTGSCVNDYIDGKFMISNVYKTVEFITNTQCGMNSCGENVFCLPPLSNIKVSLKAASLLDCNGSSDNCLPTVGIIGDYPECSSSTAGDPGVCQNTNGENYPQASDSIDGIIDAANNSLDGDKNGDAEGPQVQSGKLAFSENEILGECTASAGGANGRVCSYYNADKVCGSADYCEQGSDTVLYILDERQNDRGDDYTWSFFTSDKIDLSSPIIEEAKGGRVNTPTVEKLLVDAGKQVLGIDTARPITFLFNKLMMSSTIKPGRNYGDEDIYPGTNPPIQKEYFVFANFSGRPLGYWCSKEDLDTVPDGYPDKTRAIISHA